MLTREDDRTRGNRWTLWFDMATGKQNPSNWGSSMRQVITFATVEEFWGYVHDTKPLIEPNNEARNEAARDSNLRMVDGCAKEKRKLTFPNRCALCLAVCTTISSHRADWAMERISTSSKKGSSQNGKTRPAHKGGSGPSTCPRAAGERPYWTPGGCTRCWH